MDVLFASKNVSKIKEVKAITAGTRLCVRSMEEAGFFFDTPEDGDTYAENAVKKARALCLASGTVSIADDSGLEIDFLGGGPGVQSAFYMGRETPYHQKNRHILALMDGLPHERRGARFVCAIAAVFPDGRVFVEEACLEGVISDSIGGDNGFGYDPIFFVPEMGCTTAEMPVEQKNRISHRYKALRQIINVLHTIGGD